MILFYGSLALTIGRGGSIQQIEWHSIAGLFQSSLDFHSCGQICGIQPSAHLVILFTETWSYYSGRVALKYRTSGIFAPESTPLLQVDRDMTCPGPELEFRVEVDDPGILRRIHVDARIRQRVNLSLGSGETLRIPYDNPLIREDRDIAKQEEKITSSLLMSNLM